MGKFLLSTVFGLVFIATVTVSVSAQIQVPPPPDALPNPPELVEEGPLIAGDRPSQAPPAPGKPGPVELEASTSQRPPSGPAQAQLRRSPGGLLDPSGSIRVESLDAPDGPGSVELEATKVPRRQSWILGLKEERTIGIAILLVFSLLGNAFQFYRQRFYGKTICNELVSTFNSVAWLLARCVNKTKELDGRTTDKKAGDRSLHKEFREFSLDTEFMLQALQEQLVAVARNLLRRDRSWNADQFGYSLEEVQKIRRAFSERPVGEWSAGS
ncbi:MAG: hypothetical protein ACE5I0_07975 [Candidatus Binatia bacterium]